MLKLLRFLTRHLRKEQVIEPRILLEECLQAVASTTIVKCNTTVHSLVMHKYPVCAGVVFPANNGQLIMTPEYAQHLLNAPNSISIITRNGFLSGESNYNSYKMAMLARTTFPTRSWPDTTVVWFELLVSGTRHAIAFVKHTPSCWSKKVIPIMMSMNDLV